MTRDDLVAFQAYRGISELGRYQGWLPMSETLARAFLAESGLDAQQADSRLHLAIMDAAHNDVLKQVLLDLKARREEAWLSERFEGYAAYMRRTRRFIPGLY